jgi:hypothetical protein
MGSSGTGRFTDYTGTPNQPSNDGNNSSSGGTSGTDRCKQAFSADLEDIADYDFFSTSGNVPSEHSELSVTVRGRVIAVDSRGIAIGALPTRFNYLAGCIEEGISYSGVVTHSSLGSSPRVSADFSPM